MDVSHPKVKYHWFISLSGISGGAKAISESLPKLVKISKKGLIFDRHLSTEFLKLLRKGPEIIYLRIMFKLQGHANWRTFDIKRPWPANTDPHLWPNLGEGDLDKISPCKELFFNLEEEAALDFNFTFDQSKF